MIFGILPRFPGDFKLAGTREIGNPDLAGIGGIGNTEIPILPGSGLSAPMPRHRGFRGLEAPGTRDSEDSGAAPESPWASCALERFSLLAGQVCSGAGSSALNLPGPGATGRDLERTPSQELRL
jgi:hypothetical protein